MNELLSDPTPDEQPPTLTGPLRALCDESRLLTVDEPELELQRWLDLSSAILQVARDLRHRIEQLAIQWIAANGPIQVGDIRYVVGHTKSVRCIDSAGCMVQVLEACHGDVGGVTEFLGSNPWKYGSVRNLLGDEAFHHLFVSETKAKLVEGKPQPELLGINTHFAKPRRHTTSEEKDSQ